jgi:hypothetical protein
MFDRYIGLFILDFYLIFVLNEFEDILLLGDGIFSSKLEKHPKIDRQSL